MGQTDVVKLQWCKFIFTPVDKLKVKIIQFSCVSSKNPIWPHDLGWVIHQNSKYIGDPLLL